MATFTDECGRARAARDFSCSVARRSHRERAGALLPVLRAF